MNRIKILSFSKLLHILFATIRKKKYFIDLFEGKVYKKFCGISKM